MGVDNVFSLSLKEMRKNYPFIILLNEGNFKYYLL